ncbi:hypothetical protein C8A05DRAFT_16105, partial [Staphylotrichum tortipilum]
NRKHQNNHTRPRKCPYCTTYPGGAEAKDLARHVRRDHPEETRRDRRWAKEVRKCPKCGKYMRGDNYKMRHSKTCGGIL